MLSWKAYQQFKLDSQIALRYIRYSKNKFILFSNITWIAIIGIFLGISVPIIVISVMTGFQKEIQNKFLNISGHLTLSSTFENSIVINQTNALFSNDLIKSLKEIPGIKSVIPIIETHGILKIGNSYIPILVKAIGQSTLNHSSFFKDSYQIIEGKNDLSKTYYAHIGKELYNTFDFIINDRIELIIPDTSKNEVNSIHVKCKITGVFKTGLWDYDYGVIYVSLSTLQRKLNMENEVNQILLHTDNLWNVDDIRSKLMKKYGIDFNIQTWKEINRNLFEALAIERVMMWVILLFILVVAIFNVISSQIILVLRKKKDIGILKTLGMTPIRIARVFMIQSTFITLSGSFLGVFIGSIISLNINYIIAYLESMTGFELFPQGVYYIEAIPNNLELSTIVYIVLFAFLFSSIGSLFPAYQASQINAVKIIKENE